MHTCILSFRSIDMSAEVDVALDLALSELENLLQQERLQVSSL